MKKVSVIMPCYNDGAYLEESVESVLTQTYENMELIIIDDGSDDGETCALLDRLAQRERVVLLRSNHLGPSGARNFGIARCTGEYILPVDADDRIHPTYAEKAAAILDADEHVGVVYCQAELFGAESGRWYLSDYNLDSMLVDNIVFVTSMFRKADWETVGGFSQEMTHGMEDYDFWLSLLELGREIVQIPEILFYYRKKAVSRTTRFQQDIDVVKETYRELYLRHPALYDRHQHRYAMLLRDSIIDMVFEKREMQQNMQQMQTYLENFEKIRSNIIYRVFRKLYRLFNKK